MSQYLTSEEIAQIGLRAVGRGVLIHRHCNLVMPENISIGDHTRIDGFTTIVGSGAVTIGRYVHIGSLCFIAGAHGVEIGEFSTLSHGCKAFSVSDDYSGASMTNPSVPERYKNLEKGAVRIGRHVIVGTNSVILPGAVLEEGAAVGALSLVRGTLAGWTIHAGTPARAIKPRKRDALRLEQEFLANEARETGAGDV